MSSLNTIEFGHLIQYLLYILQYILQKCPKTCGHFCCGQSSDNIFWTPHNLKYMAHMQNPDCKTFYVSRSSSSCDHRKFLLIIGTHIAKGLAKNL